MLKDDGSTGPTGAQGQSGVTGPGGPTGAQGAQGNFGGATFDYTFRSKQIVMPIQVLEIKVR